MTGPLARQCVTSHLDDKPRVATHVAYTADDETDVYEVCESCAKGLLANRWLVQPRLLDAEAGTQEIML